MVAETNPLITATRTVLRDIAKHAHALATGLQNAAPHRIQVRVNQSHI